MSLHRQFCKDAATKAADKRHRQILAKATGTHYGKVEARKLSQYFDWENAREQAATIKDYVLDHLPDLLVEFEEKITARGVNVHWAADAEEARLIIGEITQQHEAAKVVKSKSMTTEEIGLNEFLESRGIEVCESDLGELIVQLRGEKPYHILTPAMHLSKSDIAELFHERFGTPLEASAEELTMAARAHLRQAYVTADIGITGVNFMLAEDGAIAMVENEGNGRLSMACPKVHIAIAGIEKMLPSSRDLSFFLPLLTTSGTGQQLNAYTSIVRGPRMETETDGPEEMHVILLDNGRSDLLAQPEMRQALRCIRCGACLNICPVYKTIGGHAYHATYQGPIGSVITPQYDGLLEYQHLAHASTLCGACSTVCPVNIELSRLIHHNRVLADQQKANDASWRVGLRMWAKAATSRKRYDLARKGFEIGEPLIKRLLPEPLQDRIPELPEHTFTDYWRAREQSRQDSE